VGKTKRLGIVAAVVAAVTGFGCYGQFALTRKIYDWNGRATNNKFANSVITWALIVVPVYEVCALADFLVFNTVEVFSGRNPLAQEQGSDGGLRLRYAGRDYQLTPTDDGQVEVRSAGVATIRYRVAGATIQISDGAGRPLRTLEAPQALAARRSASVY
jgi:hypothetical protein